MINFNKPYYEITVKQNHNFARFFHYLRSNQVIITSVKSDEDSVSFQIPKKALSVVRKGRRKFKLSLSVSYVNEVEMIPLQQNTLIGIILFITIPIILSSFLWNIELVEATPELSYGVTQLLKEDFHIKFGTPTLQIAPQYEIRQKIIKNYPEISWVFINRQGSKLRLQFQYVPEITQEVKEEKVGNLIAKTSGIITHWRIVKGEKVITRNQTVFKDDLLVTGTIYFGDQPTVVGAIGEVYADYWLETNFEIPTTIQTEHRELEGWKVYGIRLPKKGESVAKMLSSIIKVEPIIEYNIIEHQLTEADVDTIILPLLERKIIGDSPPSTKVKSQKLLHLDVQDDTVKGKILFLINENIAELQPIVQGEDT